MLAANHKPMVARPRVRSRRRGKGTSSTNALRSKTHLEQKLAAEINCIAGQNPPHAVIPHRCFVPGGEMPHSGPHHLNASPNDIPRQQGPIPTFHIQAILKSKPYQWAPYVKNLSPGGQVMASYSTSVLRIRRAAGTGWLAGWPPSMADTPEPPGGRATKKNPDTHTRLHSLTALTSLISPSFRAHHGPGRAAAKAKRLGRRHAAVAG